MTNDPRVRVYLVIVPALERLIPEEVYRRVIDAARLLGFGLEVLQAVPLVPARRKDVEGDLAADGKAACLSSAMPLVFSEPETDTETTSLE